MADSDLELREGERGVGRCGFDLLPLLAFLPSVISSLLPKIRGGAGPSPRSATGIYSKARKQIIVELNLSKM